MLPSSSHNPAAHGNGTAAAAAFFRGQLVHSSVAAGAAGAAGGPPDSPPLHRPRQPRKRLLAAVSEDPTEALLDQVKKCRVRCDGPK